MDTKVKLKAGLYGSNGHQLTHLLGEPHPLVDIHAVCGVTVPEDALIEPRAYPTLPAMLEDSEIDFVSLCSPRRVDQVEDALLCLRAGKHVLAEKPSAFSEADLDMLLAEAAKVGREFREMGGTVIAQPYWALRKVVLSGQIGEVVQVFAQKSYPYFSARPQDESVDGGLFFQVGIHAARMIEHGSGLELRELTRIETRHGNPAAGDLKMASGFQGRLANGGLATAIANYLNPRGFGNWGNEALRVFGTKGMVEVTDGGSRSRLVVEDQDLGTLPSEEAPMSYLSLYAQNLLGQRSMPLSLEEELHPLRALLRAK